MNPELFGGIAAFLTTAAFLPQAVRVLATNDTASISLATYAIFVVGLGFWEVYGWMIGSIPIIAANLVTILFAGVILAQKIRHVVGVRRA
ncbi:MAG: SemiSWEET transporter [Pseudomonadota bacterium]